MESKTCIDCGRIHPATTEFFHKFKDGLNARCRACRNKKDRKGRALKRNEKLDEIERGGVDLFIKAARLGGATIPHSSELLETMMEYFGGVRGFTNAFMKQFYQAPVGGAFRTKMLDTVIRLVSQNTAMGGAKKPLDLMTEQELEAEARRRIMEAALAITGKVKGHEVRNLQVLDAPESGMGAVPAIPANEPGGEVHDAEQRVVRRVE